MHNDNFEMKVTILSFKAILCWPRPYNTFVTKHFSLPKTVAKVKENWRDLAISDVSHCSFKRFVKGFIKHKQNMLTFRIPIPFSSVTVY